MAEDDTPNPFTRPGFIAGAVVVAALIVTAIILTVLNLNRGSEAAPPTPTPTSTASSSATPSQTPSGSTDSASICGLKGEKMAGTVSTAPDATWQFQDVYAYPSSPVFGPGETATEGYRYCFQHSPEGSLFAAANMTIALFGDVETRAALLDYALTDGTYRDALLSEVGETTGSDVRASIAGFRVLSYDGDAARVDVAFRASTQGQVANGSAVFDLVWSEGDWKINSNIAEPFRLAQLPDTSGYVNWRQE